MSAPIEASMPQHQPRTAAGLPVSRSLLFALLLEAGLLALGAAWLLRPAPPPQPEVVPLAFAEPDLNKPPKPEPKKPEPPKVVPKIKVVVPPTPVRPQTPPPPQPTPPEPKPVQEPPPAEQPFAKPVTPPPPPPPPPAASSTAQAEADFADHLRAAIQAAMAYPMAARQMGLYGKARVRFQFIDGQTSAVTMVGSSGYAMLDRAALAAVGNAAYPVPPESLRGKLKTYEITLTFDLSAAK